MSETSKKIRLTLLDKYTVIATFIMGFISYGYLITNNLINYDSLYYQHTPQNIIASGRQFLTYACGISSTFDLRWFNAVLAMAYLALTSMVLVRLFEVKKPITAVLIAAFMVAFPSVTSTMYHAYTVDGYMLAVLCSVLAVYLTKKWWWGFIPSLFLVGFAIGVYQIYYSCTIVLAILVLMTDLIYEKEFKKILNRTVRYVLMGIGGYAFYAISLKVMLAVQGASLSGHQGTDFVNHFPFQTIPEGLAACVKSFVRFAVNSGLLDNNTALKSAYIGVVILSAAEFIYLMLSNRMHREWYRILCLIFLLAVLPFGTTIVLIVSPTTYVHSLMRMPWVLFFVFAMSLGERIIVTGKKEKYFRGIVNLNYFCAFVMLFNFAISANVVGYTLNERYERSYALCLRIVDRLEQTEGFSTADKLAVIGGAPNRTYYYETCESWPYVGEYFTACGEYVPGSPITYALFIRHYLGLTMDVPTDEALLEISSSEEFAQMSCFPAADCVKQIDGVWVVKLNQ